LQFDFCTTYDVDEVRTMLRHLLKLFGFENRLVQRQRLRRHFLPSLQCLEERLAPATVSYTAATGELDFTASTTKAETVSVTAPKPSQLVIQVSTGDNSDSITLLNDAVSNSDFVLSKTTVSNDTLTIDINAANGGATINTFNVYLANQNNSPDTLSFGVQSTLYSFLGTFTYVQDVNIGGPASGSAPGPDTNDSVTLDTTSISGSLNVSAGTINVDAGTSAPHQGVQAANVTLNSVNSLQMQPTAVPYLGNVTIHATPPAPQPYAGYPYLTGPDWGAYGYQPGDTVTISSSAPGFDVTTTIPGSSTTSISTIAAASAALQPPNHTDSYEGQSVIDFNDNESSGLESFSGSQLNPLPMPGASSTTPTESDYTNFVVQATADVYIPAAATWTFGTNSDDGVQLMVGNTTVLDDDTTNSPTDTFGTFTATSPGLYPLTLLYFNHNGPGNIQLFAVQGNWNSFSAANFELVGDTAAGGLSVTTVGSPSGYTVEKAVGDNLYLVNSTANPLPPGNYSGVTVAIASGTFTPQINASNSLSLNVTGPEMAITGAVTAANLAATTANGNITLNVLNTVALETINAGNANIDLDAQGSILSGSVFLPATANLEAGSVNLTTTGTGSSIGPGIFPLSMDTAELTAATNDGSIHVTNRVKPLTIDSVVADQNGQTPTVNDDQVVYNSTPDQLTPTYIAGSSNVTISSQGPIVLNSISATGSVSITGMYLVEGNGQTPSIIAPSVSLTATGKANYQGQVTFANSSGGDTLTLPGAATTIASGSNGASLPQSTIAVASTTGFPSSGTIAITTASKTVYVNYTGTTATSFIGCSGGSGTLATGAAVATQAWTSYGFMNGTAMAGLPIVVSGASDTGNDGTFTVKSISGNTLTFQQGNVLDPETEFLVSVGDGMIGLENSSSSSTSSSASTAESAVELTEVGNFTATTTNGNIFLTLGGSVDSTAADVNAGGTGNVALTSQASFLTIENITANGATPAGGSTLVGGDVAVDMNSGALVEYGNPGLITGQNVALTSPLSIGTPSSPLLTNASSGLSVTANATSPSSAAVYVDNASNLTSLGVSTYDGTTVINYDGSYDINTGTLTYAGLLSFSNNQLSATGSAVVSFANTDNNDGSNDNVFVNGTIDANSITAGGRILAGTNALITGQAVELSAGTGIGLGAGANAINTSVTALDVSTNTGNIEINQIAIATSGSGATVNITTDNGAITSVTLGTGGSGYPANSTFGLMVKGGGGTGGVVEAMTDSSGAVTSMTLVAGGGGYANTNRAATSVATAGSGATVDLTTDNGAITSVTFGSGTRWFPLR
jgi:hypothetical protein